MQRLAQLLIQEKILDRRTCEEILEAQAVYGGTFDTNILEMGILDERTLQTYLERAMGVPNRVDPFTEADAKAVALLKRDQAQKYRIVPFRLNLRQLDILINDPSDVRAIDEVSFITGCRVTVSIATEVRMAYHLFTNYQIGLPHRLQQILMNRVAPRPKAAFDADARSKANALPAGDDMPSISIGAASPQTWPDGSRDAPSISAEQAVRQQRSVSAEDAVRGQRGTDPHLGRGTSPPLDELPDKRRRITDGWDVPQRPVTTPPAPPRSTTAPPVIGAPGAVAPFEVPLPPPQLPVAARPPTVPPPAQGDTKSTYFGPPPFEQYPEFEKTPPAQPAPAPPPDEHAVPPAVVTPTAVKRNYDVLAAQLGQVADRDEIPPIVLGYLSVLLSRVYLFTVRADRLVGWDARGKKVKRDVIGGLSFPLDRPSVFTAVINAGLPFDGKLPQDDVEESLVIKVGADEWPEHILIVPVRVKDRCVAILYGEAASPSALAEAREPAVALAEMMSEAFVRLILQKKQKS